MKYKMGGQIKKLQHYDSLVSYSTLVNAIREELVPKQFNFGIVGFIRQHVYNAERKGAQVLLEQVVKYLQGIKVMDGLNG